MKRKRGSSHVGVVLSFVLFVTSMIFIYVIIQPILQKDDKKNSLSYVEAKLLERSMSDLTTASVPINGDTQTCVALNGFFSASGLGNKIVIQNEYGNVLSNSRISSDGQNLLVQRDNIDDDFIKIYESDEFNILPIGSISPCPGVGEGASGYAIGAVKTSKNVFSSKIEEVIDEHDANYQSLKQNMGISSGDNFGISFEYSDGTKTSTDNFNSAPSQESVFSEEIKVQYVNIGGSTESGVITLRLW